MFRKFLSFLVLAFFSISLTSPSVLADEYMDYLLEDVSYNAQILEEVPNGSKYKSQIDTFFEKNGENAKLMNKLDVRLWDVEDSIYYDGADETTSAIVFYLRAKLNIALEATYEQQEKIRQETAKKVADEMFASTISESERLKAETEILALQKNIFTHGNTALETILGDIQQAVQVEEKGDFSMSFNFDQKQIGTASGNISLSDYSAKSDVFDSQITGYMDGFVAASMRGGDDINLQIKSFLDFISKDGNMYLLMEKLSFDYSGEDQDIMQTLIEKIKEYSEKGTYMKLADEETQMILGQLQALNFKDLGRSIEVAVDTAMFEAYKKEGNTYFLKPTKHFCDTLKDVTSRFDPFYGSTCSDGQYQELLADMAYLGGDLTLTLGDTNTLTYKVTNQYGDNYEAAVEFTGAYIKGISLSLILNQEEYPGEGVSFEYERKSHISLNALAETMEIDMFAALDVKERIYEMESTLSIGDVPVGKLSLKDGKVTGSLNYTSQGYDWDTGELVDGLTYTAEITGTWNGQGFDTLDFEMNIQDTQNGANITDIRVGYTEKMIDANIQVLTNGEEVFTMNLGGNLETEYIDLEAIMELQSSDIQYLFPGEDTATMNVDIFMDTRNMKNNVDIYFDAKVGEQTPLQIDIKNTGTRAPYTGEIQAPKNSIELEKVLEEEIYY